MIVMSIEFIELNWGGECLLIKLEPCARGLGDDDSWIPSSWKVWFAMMAWYNGKYWGNER